MSASGLMLGNMAAAQGTYPEPSRAEDSASLRTFDVQSTARLDFNFDHEWQFFRPVGETHEVSHESPTSKTATPPSGAVWEAATLPHSVRLEPFDASGGQNYQGICWYRKKFSLKPDWRNRILYLKFQAAMQVADVCLNGTLLTTHYGGYIPFVVDISKAAVFDRENDLVVHLDNRDNPDVPPGKPQNQLDFVYFGGLYRSVELQVLDRLHITDPILRNTVAGGGIFVTYPEVSAVESVVSVRTEVANESNAIRRCMVVQELIGPNAEVVVSATENGSIEPGAIRTIQQALKVKTPRLWHPEDPQLYWLHTAITQEGHIIDEQFTRIGIRSIRFDRDRGLLINGEPFFSIGANRHQDHPYVGYALPPSVHFRDARKLREAGFTSYRSHYPQDPSFMDACDELGILAIVSNPGWQFIGGKVFRDRVYQGAREMIRRDRNHPCVVIWEAALNETDNSSVAAELYRVVHQEYPGPECFSAGDPIHKPVEGFNGWDIGYLGLGRKETSRASWIREWGDQVDNWSDQQGRVRVARGWGEIPMQVQASSHLSSLEKIYASETLPTGADLWAGIDAYRGYHHQPFLGAPLDLFRLPKFDYFMFQSQRPPDAKPFGVGSGPMVFIANFASFHSAAAVTVFSNCEQVRLYQNGKLVSTQKPDTGLHIPHPPFTFQVGDFSATHSMLYANGIAPAGTEIGELKAEGLIGGKVAASHLIHSPGVPTQVLLELDTCGLDPVANGADWLRIYARICDARETIHPHGDDYVTFSVSGEGSLIGGEAISSNPVRAEAGIATCLVRTTRSPGRVEVRASAPGLKDATLQFTSKASTAPTWP